MRGFPTTYWAKLERVDGEVVAWHPLIDHCADVGAVAEALLERTILGRRLAVLGGLKRLSRPQVARLATFAALHDAGKCNNGFQGRARPSPRRCSKNWAGHLTEILAPLLTGGYGRKSDLIDALALHECAEWIEPDEALEHFVAVIFSHHGKPVPFKTKMQDWWWEVRGGRDPVAGVAELTAATRRWFPEARDRNAHPLPGSPAFQHAWAGLLMLADWIGSDSERFFPFSEEGEGDRMELARDRSRKALAHLGLDTAPLRVALGPGLPCYEWARAEWLEPDAEPRPAQRKILELPRPEAGSVAVLEAATGAGKTEAAIAHFLRLFHEGRVDGMYFALPTRTAATQIHGRVVRAVKAAFPEDARPPVVLAVPGYLRVDDQKGRRLPEFRVLWNDDADERYRYRGWAAESSKRYLAGAVAVGTIDQVLLSALAIPHAHLRASALLRHLLVVDEVHASSVYMTRILEGVLDQHVASGGHAFLMSATLGASSRARLLAPPGRRSSAAAEAPSLDEAERLAYPAVSFSVGGGETKVLDVGGRPESKRVEVKTVPWIDEPERVAARALEAARAGARVAIVRNTVGGCCAVQGALEDQAAGDDGSLLFTCNGLPTPHHSRYSGEDRKRLDGAVEQAFGRDRPAGGCVVAATQTIEQSLDLDADLLLTDLAPMDVLLQRIGRLHRHRRENRPPGFETARVMVLVPEERNLASLIHPQHDDARGPHGLGPVYEDLRVLEATWRLLLDRERIEVPAENRLLVERSTHPEVLGRIVDEGGDAWRRHQRHLMGEGLAHRRIAWYNRLARDQDFAEVANRFPPRPGPRDRDKLQNKISARLGEFDRLVRFEAPPASPFGTYVSELRLPEHRVREVPPDVETAEDVIPAKDGFTFRYGPCLFRYDRWGVAPVEEMEK